MTTVRRSGVSALLTSLRVGFENPLSRNLLKIMSRRIECNGRDVTILSESLRCLVERTGTCFIARFYSIFLRVFIEAGVAFFNGNRNDVWKALQDPAVRRGLALVFEGLGLYGVTVPQRLPAPFLVVWNFTNLCNLRCVHCYQNAEKKLSNELTLKEKLDVVDQLDRAGVAALALSGGEPTIHPHFLPIVRKASERGIYTAVATNGWMFADISFARKARRAGLRYVEVSIDSADPKKHDRFRGVDGSWERAVKGLRNAVKLGFSTAMAVTLTKLNVDEVNEILDLAEDLGVERVVFFNFIPVGRGEDIVNLDLNPEERERVLRRLYLESSRRSVDIISTAPQYSRVALQLSEGRSIIPTHFYCKGDPITAALAEFIGGCGAGRIYVALQPDGSVVPCVFMPIVVGNLRSEPFWKIWRKSPVLKTLRDRNKLTGGCSLCYFKYICGGCRARAYAYTGNIMGPDPGCINNLNAWRELSLRARNEITVCSPLSSLSEVG